MAVSDDRENRPDWIQCVTADVGKGHRMRGETWCGRSAYKSAGFSFFTTIDHAAFNGLDKGRLVACKDCVKAITEALSNGHK